MGIYKALSNIKRDGEQFAAGAIVEIVDDVEAAALIVDGVLQEIKEEAEEHTGPLAPPSDGPVPPVNPPAPISPAPVVPTEPVAPSTPSVPTPAGTTQEQVLAALAATEASSTPQNNGPQV